MEGEKLYSSTLSGTVLRPVIVTFWENLKIKLIRRKFKGTIMICGWKSIKKTYECENVKKSLIEYSEKYKDQIVNFPYLS